MRSDLCVAVLCGILGVVVGQTPHSMTYECLRAGDARSIKYTFTQNSDAKLAAVGAYDPADVTSDCGLTLDGSAVSISLANAAGGTTVDLAALPKCVSQVGGKAELFAFKIVTSVCTGKFCAALSSKRFEMECDFGKTGIASVKLAAGLPVTDNLKPETLTKVQKPITLAVNDAAGKAVTTVKLGDPLTLKVTCTLTATMQGLQLTDVIVYQVGKRANSITLYDATGCASKALKWLPAGVTGFVKKTGAKLGDPYESELAGIPAIRFTADASKSGGDIVFALSAKYCTKSYTECDNSCVPAKRRRRRDAPEEGQKKIFAVLNVLPQGAVIPTENRTVKEDCEHRSYIIALVILGCVLTLTFVVSVGMFVMFRRRQGNGDKMGFTNNGMS